MCKQNRLLKCHNNIIIRPELKINEYLDYNQIVRKHTDKTVLHFLSMSINIDDASKTNEEQPKYDCKDC